MSFVILGVTHCTECLTSLNDDEVLYCTRCQKEKEEKIKEFEEIDNKGR